VPKLSVTVIARNEASCLAEALTSAAWADEIVVVDAESTDDTVAVARQHAHTVVVRPWTGYGDQKNHAASIASHDWILSLDADERITPALAGEIHALLATEPTRKGYRVPRVAYHLGRWVRTTDFYPDYQTRLYDRRSARWTGLYVHESVSVDGGPGQLANELQHYSYRDLSDHLDRINHYSSLAARHTNPASPSGSAAAISSNRRVCSGNTSSRRRKPTSTPPGSRTSVGNPKPPAHS